MTKIINFLIILTFMVNPSRGSENQKSFFIEDNFETFEPVQEIKQSFRKQLKRLKNLDIPEQNIQIEKIIHSDHSMQTAKGFYKAQTLNFNKDDFYFVKIYSNSESRNAINLVKEYFQSKELKYSEIVFHLWTDSFVFSNKSYLFSVFPFIDAKNIDQIQTEYFEGKNIEKNLKIFQKLGNAVIELHNIGLTGQEWTSQSIHGDLHNGNILFNPSLEKFFFIDYDTMAKNILTPAPLSKDLVEIFNHGISLAFIEEYSVLAENFHLAFCRGYLEIFLEKKEKLKEYLIKETLTYLYNIFIKREIFYQDLKILSTEKCTQFMHHIKAVMEKL